MKIKEIPIESRPREKATRYGIEALNDEELLAILIGSGVRGCSAIEIARNLLSTYPNLNQLAKTDLLTLSNHFGLSDTTSLKLLSTFEIHNRLNSPMYQNASKIETADDVYLRYRYLENYTREILGILMLSKSNKILKEKILYVGTENNLTVNSTEICSELLISKCKKYILIHNHPGGEKLPSEDDFYTTQVIEKQADNLGIKLVDHLIIFQNGYYSFKEHKKLGN